MYQALVSGVKGLRWVTVVLVLIVIKNLLYIVSKTMKGVEPFAMLCVRICADRCLRTFLPA